MGHYFNESPKATPGILDWLQSRNLSGHAIDNLPRSRQLTSVKNGVYNLDGSSVAWGDINIFVKNQFIRSDDCGAPHYYYCYYYYYYYKLSAIRTKGIQERDLQ